MAECSAPAGCPSIEEVFIDTPGTASWQAVEDKLIELNLHVVICGAHQ